MLRGEPLQSSQCVELQDSCALVDSERIEIFLYERSGRRMIFDKHDLGSVAAQRFDADGPSPRKKIKEVATGNSVGEDVKK